MPVNDDEDLVGESISIENRRRSHASRSWCNRFELCMYALDVKKIDRGRREGRLLEFGEAYYWIIGREQIARPGLFDY